MGNERRNNRNNNHEHYNRIFRLRQNAIHNLNNNIKKECIMNELKTQIYFDYKEEIKKKPQEEENNNIDLDEENMCSICLLAYKDDDVIAKSHNEECSHIYHKDCIVQWLLLNKTECPNCRKPYIANMQ